MSIGTDLDAYLAALKQSSDTTAAAVAGLRGLVNANSAAITALAARVAALESARPTTPPPTSTPVVRTKTIGPITLAPSQVYADHEITGPGKADGRAVVEQRAQGLLPAAFPVLRNALVDGVDGGMCIYGNHVVLDGVECVHSGSAVVVPGTTNPRNCHVIYPRQLVATDVLLRYPIAVAQGTYSLHIHLESPMPGSMWWEINGFEDQYPLNVSFGSGGQPIDHGDCTGFRKVQPGLTIIGSLNNAGTQHGEVVYRDSHFDALRIHDRYERLVFEGCSARSIDNPNRFDVSGIAAA